MVRTLNVDGDGQGDLGGRGGEQRAVLVYQIDSYRHWEKHLARDDFEYGQFGENFTVDGLGDDEVCVGATPALAMLHQLAAGRASLTTVPHLTPVCHDQGMWA